MENGPWSNQHTIAMWCEKSSVWWLDWISGTGFGLGESHTKEKGARAWLCSAKGGPQSGQGPWWAGSWAWLLQVAGQGRSTWGECVFEEWRAVACGYEGGLQVGYLRRSGGLGASLSPQRGWSSKRPSMIQILALSAPPANSGEGSGMETELTVDHASMREPP